MTASGSDRGREKLHVWAGAPAPARQEAVVLQYCLPEAPATMPAAPALWEGAGALTRLPRQPGAGGLA